MFVEIKSAADCRFDIVAMGEVMLRLDPGASRVRTARRFEVWEGGGEYNVARGLSKCFGLRGALVSALVDNEVGRLIENSIHAGGVDTQFVQWRDFDGVGRRARNGLNFTERGFGLRSALGISDRANTAASQLKVGDIDWDQVFAGGVRWFHTGGVFAALSETTPEVILDALSAARRHGIVTSYDLNYRSSLWQEFGGPKKCREVNQAIAPLVDVMLGNEEDFTACLGLEVKGLDDQLSSLPIDGFHGMIENAIATYPNLRMVATTLRTVKTATINNWGAALWCDGQLYQAQTREGLEIFDRVGGGDSFAAGLIFGLMDTGDPQVAVNYGAAHGALAMTTPGDTSMATRAEVEALMTGNNVRVRR